MFSKHRYFLSKTALFEKAYFSLSNHTLYVALLRRESPPQGNCSTHSPDFPVTKRGHRVFLLGRKKPLIFKNSHREGPGHTLPFAHTEDFAEIH